MSAGSTPLFEQYIGIDYSGAGTAVSQQRGIRVFKSSGDGGDATPVLPQGGLKHWSRKELAGWLIEQLRSGPRTIVGIDHAFSFPRRYFEQHGIEPDWSALLEFQRKYWPTGDDGATPYRLHQRVKSDKSIPWGEISWRRQTEIVAASAKSVFHVGVPGQVGLSTLAGIPWLGHIRESLTGRIHLWPFDGWEPAAGRSLIVEVYPRLWSEEFPNRGWTSDEHDAYVVAKKLQALDASGRLIALLKRPPGADDAQFEGWILDAKPPRATNTAGRAGRKRTETSEERRAA